jgi:hypothetical protein
MEEKTKVQELVLRIAKNEFSEEMSAYRAIEGHVTQKLFDSKDAPSIEDIVADSNASNEFDPTAIVEILKSLSVLVGTVKTIYEIRKMVKAKSDIKIDNITSQWKKDLIQNNISEAQAEVLVQKYKNDLKSIIS